jgi:homoserine O-acetyltransferase
MDTHDIQRNRTSLDHAAPALVVGVDTDILYPPQEQQELARMLSKSEYAELVSPYGHDAFLIEQKQLNVLLTRWLHTHNSNPTTDPTLKTSPINAAPVDCGV